MTYQANSAIIFRLQLFKPSETFITAQGDHLSRYEPTYLGWKVFGSANGRKSLVAGSRSTMADRLGILRMLTLRDPTTFLRALNGKVPNVIHAHFGVDGVYAAPVAERLKTPLVTTLHGFDVTRRDVDFLRSMRPALVNYVAFRSDLYKRTDIFACVSEFIRQAAISRGFPENKLRVHHIGIDTQKITQRAGLGDEGLIVHVARLVEKKGTRFLLRAVAKIAPEHPNARLVIIGDGPLRQSLESQVRELGIGDRVQFLGMRPNEEVLAWDAKAAVKAVPSITGSDGDQEGLPTVITETFALGVPVVAFSSGGIKEVVLHGETGFLSPEADVDGLAHHLSILLHDRDLRLRMGKAARMLVEAEFNIRTQTSRLEDIYDEARNQHS